MKIVKVEITFEIEEQDIANCDRLSSDIERQMRNNFGLWNKTHNFKVKCEKVK